MVIIDGPVCTNFVINDFDIVLQLCFPFNCFSKKVLQLHSLLIVLHSTSFVCRNTHLHFVHKLFKGDSLEVGSIEIEDAVESLKTIEKQQHLSGSIPK